MPADLSTSPVFPLLRAMEGALFAVAPERKRELEQVIRNHGISVALDQVEDRFCLTVDSDKKQITFGVATAERLWAFCYAYVVLISVVQERGPGVEIDLTVDPTHYEAMQLLAWAYQGEISGRHETWPAELARPRPDDAPGLNGYAASELFLCQLGWSLLHEVGHLVLHHEPNSDPEKQIALEYAADDWATTWLLGQWQSYAGDDPRVFAKRTLGATFALCVSVAKEAHRYTGGGRFHPNPAQRLLHFLDQYVGERNAVKAEPKEFAWFAATSIIQLHLMAENKAGPPTAEHLNFRSFLVDAARRLVPVSSSVPA